jgi:hypothetical protein
MRLTANNINLPNGQQDRTTGSESRPNPVGAGGSPPSTYQQTTFLSDLKTVTFQKPDQTGRGASAGRAGTAVPEPGGGRNPGERDRGINPGSLLVPNAILEQTGRTEQTEIAKQLPTRTRQQKQKGRLFSTIHSGLTWNQKEILRFLTLTSAPNSPDLSKDFKMLLLRIKRTTPRHIADFHTAKYEKVMENAGLETIKKFYKDKPIDEPLKIQYCKLETDEGNGVIHALCVGDYLPQDWLSKQWQEIHGAWNIDIRAAKRAGSGSQKFAAYMLGQYVAGQSGIIRVSCSKNWVYPGWREDQKKLIKWFGYEQGIREWQHLLSTHLTLKQYGQQTLIDEQPRRAT